MPTPEFRQFAEMKYVWLRRLENPTVSFFRHNSVERWCNEVFDNWSGVPDPYLSVRMVRRMMRVHYGWSDTVVAAIRAVCSHYMKMKPYLKQGIRPRSLKHLSRCAIRKSLKMTEQLPMGIDELGIPVELKQYLYIRC